MSLNFSVLTLAAKIGRVVLEAILGLLASLSLGRRFDSRALTIASRGVFFAEGGFGVRSLVDDVLEDSWERESENGQMKTLNPR